MKLRSYQTEAADSALAQLQQHDSTLIVLPTGMGKTVVFAEIVRRWLADHPRDRVLVVAHRSELIYQARNKLAHVWNGEIDIEMGESEARDQSIFGRNPIVIASVQTLNAGRKCVRCQGGARVLTNEIGIPQTCPDCIEGKKLRMQRFNPWEFGLCIIDEAHHATAASYRRFLKWFARDNGIKIVGVTATPDRTDESALGQVFQEVAYKLDLWQGVEMGYLVPLSIYPVEVGTIDLSEVRTTAGDLNQKDLDDVMEKESTIHGVVNGVLQHAASRPTLVFCSSVEQSRRMAEVFCRYKPDSAQSIDGETPAEHRAKILAAYSRAEFQYLVGCAVFLEGFDEPRIGCVAMARPTKSRTVYAQAIGRGTRPIVPPTQETDAERRAFIASGQKPDCLILDFVGNAGRHKLVSAADILGGRYDQLVIDRANELARDGRVHSVQELLDIAQTEAEAAKQKAEELERLKAEREKQAEADRIAAGRVTVNVPTRLGGQINPFDVFDVRPQITVPNYLKNKSPTTGQKSFLAHHLKPDQVDKLTYGQASALIDEIKTRRQLGMCSYKQASILKKNGFASDVTFESAKHAIDAIAGASWKVHHGLRSHIESVLVPVQRPAQAKQQPIAEPVYAGNDDIPF